MIIELCLATAIFFEARNQPTDGQMAVAEVILNRVADPQWPDTICGVVNQTRQFSFTHDGKSDNPTDYNEPDAWIVALLIAKAAVNGIGLVGISSTHYHTIGVHPSWLHNLSCDGRIGDHIFYSSK